MAASDHARRVAPRKNGAFFGRDVQKWPTWGTRFVDVSYDELKADPAACCEALYAKLGLPWRAEVGEAIVRHLESEESAGRSRRLPPNQRLTLEEFGLDRFTLLRPFYGLGEDRWWGHTPAWNGGVKPCG